MAYVTPGYYKMRRKQQDSKKRVNSLKVDRLTHCEEGGGTAGDQKQFPRRLHIPLHGCPQRDASAATHNMTHYSGQAHCSL